MWIERLRLHNFKGFADLQLDLDRQLTVLAGVNGVGKTSILDGLAVALGTWFLGFDGLSQRTIALSEVRLATTEGAHPNVERQYPVTVEAHGELGAAGLYWSRSKNSDGGTTTRADASQLIDIARAHQADVRTPPAHGPVDLPLIAYYGTGRLWPASAGQGARDPKQTSRTEGYQDALNPHSDQARLAGWMKQRELGQLQRYKQTRDWMLQQGLDLGSAGWASGVLSRDVDDPWLSAVEQAVVANVDGAARFYYAVDQDELVFEMKDGRVLPLAMLSDGYRNLVATVADIAWRATRLNTHHNGQAPRETAGVVLIDEVDLHLHPAWQVSVLPRLMEAFPLLQFVVTTHAPLVIGSVPAKHIRFIDGAGKVTLVSAAGGLSANVVLRELMGVPERAPDVARDLARLGRAIEAGHIGDARARFGALSAKLGTLDPELQGLEWELRQLEVHGAVD